MKVGLQTPTPMDEQAFMSYTQDFEDNMETIQPIELRLEGRSYAAWFVDQISHYLVKPENWVSYKTYFYWDNGEIVAAITLRRELNESLQYNGGHIGFAVRPSRRYYRIENELFGAILPEAKALAGGSLLVCCEKQNTKLNEAVISNGGVLEEEMLSGGVEICRYRINA
ncbi:MAG: hypothetical protein IJP30_01845 [Clostridia bacterium]|nr:hypothetical protein [Clostridia bacterium]